MAKLTTTMPQRSTSNLEVPEGAELRSADTRASKTGAGMTRAGSTKALKEAMKHKMKRVLYTNVLQLPEATLERLAREGYAHRWIRLKTSEYGRDDPANVAKWRELGYEFVTKEEAPELVYGYTPVNHGLYGDIITVGDLALAKVSIEERQALIEVKEEETLRRSKGVLTEVNRPGGVSSGRRSFVTRAQRKAEEIHEEVSGNTELLQEE